MLAPLYWMVVGSIKDTPGLFAVPPQLIPLHPTLNSYKLLMQRAIPIWIVNTAIVAVSGTVMSVVICMAAGWAFAFYRFPGQKIIYLLLLVGMMIPRQMLIIPVFIEIRKLGLVDTYLGAALPLVYNPLGIMFAANWLKSLSKSHIDDARLLGARWWNLMHHVLLPMSAPVIGVIILTTGGAALSDFMWQSLVLQTEWKWTFQLGMMNRMQIVDLGFDVGWGRVHGQSLRMAGAILLLFPVTIVGLLSQRKFVDNVMKGVSE